MLFEELISEPSKERASSSIPAYFTAIVGFVIVAVWGLKLTPWPEDFSVGVKFKHLEAHGALYDGIFVGSSNVFRSYIPEVIDEKLEQVGIPFRSFNLGGPGMYSYEADYVLRRVLELENVKPKFVFMEPETWDPRPNGAGMSGNMLTNRGLFWHDWRQTMAALRGIPPLDEPVLRKYDLAMTHLHAMCWKLTSYGQGPRILDVLREIREPQSMTLGKVKQSRGYQSLGELPHRQTNARRKLLTEAIGSYVAKIRGLNELNKQSLPSDADVRVAIPNQIEFINSHGAEALYILPPTGLERPEAFRLAEENAIQLMQYTDPMRYPQFFKAERRFDPNHLDRVGAVMFSELFGEDLAKYMQSTGER